MSLAPPSTIAGKPVGPIGYGLMGLTAWGNISHADAIPAMKAALDSGANFWNGGTFYGPADANSLHLLAAYFAAHPSDAARVVVSIKGALDRATFAPDARRVRADVDECLRILGGSGATIDMFQCARVDPAVPVEDVAREMAALVAEGKIGGYGLSEASAATVRRAHAVHPVAAVEVQLSVFSRHVLEGDGEESVAAACRELGIPLVAYSPLDRGWLGGTLRTIDDLPEGDPRRHIPRFRPGAFEQNVRLADRVAEMAGRKGCTSAQVALAWVRNQGALPIPGSTKVERVLENCKAVELDEADMAELQRYIDEIEIVGDRYPERFMSQLNR